MIGSLKIPRLLLASCALVLATTTSNAQQVITNTKGERIVIYPDGSWRLYEESDSVLLGTTLQKSEAIDLEPEPNPVTAPPAGSPNDLAEVMRLSGEFAALTQREARDANIILSNTIDQKFQLEAQLAQARENKNLVEADKVASLEDKYKRQEDLVGRAKKHQKKTRKFADKAQNILEMPVEKQGRKLTKLMVEHDNYFAIVTDLDVNRERLTTGSSSVRYSGAVATGATGAVTDPDLAASGASKDGSSAEHNIAVYRRKPAVCEAIQNSYDQESKKHQIVLAGRRIFTHTDPDLRPYFRERELVSCWAQLSQYDDNVYVSITFSIASPNARKNFISLDKGSLMRFLLLDETLVNLYNLQADSGRIDPYTGHTVFVGRYLLEKDAQKALEKSGLDKMRVVWRTGYEDYEIYDVDFFSEQFACLQSFQ